VDTVAQIISLRLAVGLLGERDSAGWWSSGFMSSTSTAFLAPVFGARVFQARYQGVLGAARRVHDERIGVGRAFHPFRLPETVEQTVHEAIQARHPDFTANVSSPETAMATLSEISGTQVAPKEGPTLIGSPDSIVGLAWVTEAASLYSAAFAAGVQCFPFFRNP
jgi:hypothetical protein